jgi:hypothetical protein
MKLTELKQLIREEIQNALNDDIIFTVDDDKLDQLLNDSYRSKLGYMDINGDSYYTLSANDFDRFIDAAYSRGFDVDYENSEDSLIYLVDRNGNPINNH